MLRTVCVFSIAGLVAATKVVEVIDDNEENGVHIFMRREAAFEQGDHGQYTQRSGQTPDPTLSHTGRSTTDLHTHANYETLLLNTDQVNETCLAAFYALDDITGREKAEAKGLICCADNYPISCDYDGCEIGDADIEGDPFLHKTSLLPGHHHDVALIPDKAIYFGQENAQNLTHSERIIIPGNEQVNLRNWGYPDKTIELWFNADHLSDDHAHALFTMGTEDTNGISIYARKHNGSETHSIDLYFYAWSRASPDEPFVQFGTEYINPEPVHCEADHHTDYYLAMVFHTHDHDPHTSCFDHPGTLHSPTIKAYLRPANTSLCAPHCTVADSLCGQMTRMPHHAVVGRTQGDEGRAVIGGMMTTSRLCGHDTSHCIMANDAAGTHNWRGTIDSVAVYNTALSEAIMQTHVDASQHD